MVAADAAVAALAQQHPHRTRHHLYLGVHARGSLHLVCAKSALGVPKVRSVAELIAEELEWAQRHSG